jgi:hypothetical protein
MQGGDIGDGIQDRLEEESLASRVTEGRDVRQTDCRFGRMSMQSRPRSAC